MDYTINIRDLIDKIVTEHPKLNYNWRVRDLRNPRDDDHNPNAYSEFYSPNESWNPYPGYPTIDVYKDSPNMKNALIGEMLHYLPEVDPIYEGLRQKFASSITPWQRKVDIDAWLRPDPYGESRSFDDFMKYSRLDAYLRAGLDPENNPEWKDILVPEQQDIISQIIQYLFGR